MTHTNEFLMGMFSAYMGSPVLETHSDGDTITDVIDWEFISRYQSNDVEGKPILTPLSEITDEDAVEVAKIMEIPQFERAKLFGCDENNYYTIGRHIKNEIIETCYNDGFYLQGAVIDYLRSKHYDCGYMHIPSLITAGLAIKKNNIKQPI